MELLYPACGEYESARATHHIPPPSVALPAACVCPYSLHSHCRGRHLRRAVDSGRCQNPIRCSGTLGTRSDRARESSHHRLSVPWSVRWLLPESRASHAAEPSAVLDTSAPHLPNRRTSSPAPMGCAEFASNFRRDLSLP